MKKAAKLVFSVVICLLVGAVGSIFTYSSIPNWYASLNKPSFNPPNWIFGPVWTALYILMGISLCLFWDRKTKSKKSYAIFSIQLGLNILWSIIFFALHSPFLAFIEIILLWIAILLTILNFHKVSKTAAYLLIPYICWVSFASVLNLFILLLN